MEPEGTRAPLARLMFGLGATGRNSTELPSDHSESVGTLLPGISQEILARMAAAEPIVRVQVKVADDGNFAYEIA